MEIEELSKNIQRLLVNLSQTYAENEQLKCENAALKEENNALKRDVVALKPIVVDLNEEKKPVESTNVMCVQNEMQIHARIRPFDAPEIEQPAPKRGGGGKKTSL